jgi:hypothetical protein
MAVLIIQVTGTEIQCVKSYILSWRLRVGFEVYEQVIAPNFFVVYLVSFQSKMSVIIYVKFWVLLVSNNTMSHGIVFA